MTGEADAIWIAASQGNAYNIFAVSYTGSGMVIDNLSAERDVRILRE